MQQQQDERQAGERQEHEQQESAARDLSPHRGRMVWRGFLYAGLLALPLALLFEGAHTLGGVPSVVEACFESAVRLVPGTLVTRGIDVLVAAIIALDLEASTASIAKAVERVGAALLFALVTTPLGVALALLSPLGWAPRRALAAVLALVPFLFSVLLTRGEWSDALLLTPALLLAGWQGFSLVLSLALFPPNVSEGRAPVSSRRALLGLGGAALLSLGGLTLLAGHKRRARNGPAGAPHPRISWPPRPPSRFSPAPGTRLELTPLEDFYRVDIHLSPPEVELATWRLVVGGLVARPLSLSYRDVDERPLAHHYATLECISNPIGGDLISTGLFSGIPLARLLEEAGVDERARALRFRCVDGYTESLPLASALDERTLLVVAMNGRRLTAEHGFPLRLYTPDRFGMKNPKWLTGIDVVDEEPAGYWVQRGWDRAARVVTTTVVDTRGRLRATGGVVSLGGVAFAGARGVARVELAVDDGPFEEAVLKPPLSRLTWVLWRHDTELAPGKHVVVARAVDGEGVPQPPFVSPPHPKGASGLHVVTIEV